MIKNKNLIVSVSALILYCFAFYSANAQLRRTTLIDMCKYYHADDETIAAQTRSGGALHGTYLQTVAASQHSGELENDQMMLEKVRNRVRQRCDAPPAPPKPRSITTIPIFDSIECKSSKFETCTGREIIEAPPGFQVCKVEYRVASQRGHRAEYQFSPTSWFNGDPEDPNRFRAYRLKVRSEGDTDYFGAGANIKLRDVKLLVIPHSAINSDRYALGCDMPRPPSSASSRKPRLGDVPLVVSYSSNSRPRGKRFLISLTNTGQTKVRINYTLDVKTERKGWFRKSTGKLNLGVGDTYTEEVFQDLYGTEDDALEWDFRHTQTK